MQDTKGKKHRSSFNINIYIPYIILVCLILVMNLNQPGLVNFRWLNRQADSWVTLALVGIGQTLVINYGMNKFDWNLPLALVIGFALAFIIG